MHELGMYDCQAKPENVLENEIIQDYCLSTFKDKYIDMTNLLQKFNIFS